MACGSSGHQVTIEAILDNAKCEKVRPGVVSSQLGRLRSLPRKAWGILNKWALEILTERGTVDVPNFMRVGWQRFRALDGEVRVVHVYRRLHLHTSDEWPYSNERTVV